MYITTWSGCCTSKLPRSAAAFTRPVAFGVVTTSIPPGGDERVHAVEEGAGIVEVLDDLSGDDEVGGRETEGAHGRDFAAVDDVRLVAAPARVLDARGVEVEPDELGRGGGEVLVEPRPRLLVQGLAPGVDEADVHDALARGEAAQVVEAIDQRRRGEPVHHLELGEIARVTHAAGTSDRRSASGGPARPRSAASTLAKVRRRLYQSRRLPSRPASGTTQNSSSGSKS